MKVDTEIQRCQDRMQQLDVNCGRALGRLFENIDKDDGQAARVQAEYVRMVTEAAAQVNQTCGDTARITAELKAVDKASKLDTIGRMIDLHQAFHDRQRDLKFKELDLLRNSQDALERKQDTLKERLRIVNEQKKSLATEKRAITKQISDKKNEYFLLGQQAGRVAGVVDQYFRVVAGPLVFQMPPQQMLQPQLQMWAYQNGQTVPGVQPGWKPPMMQMGFGGPAAMGPYGMGMQQQCTIS